MEKYDKEWKLNERLMEVKCGFWTTSSLDKIRIETMRSGHIVNAVKKLKKEREYPELALEMANILIAELQRRSAERAPSKYLDQEFYFKKSDLGCSQFAKTTAEYDLVERVLHFEGTAYSFFMTSEELEQRIEDESVFVKGEESPVWSSLQLGTELHSIFEKYTRSQEENEKLVSTMSDMLSTDRKQKEQIKKLKSDYNLDYVSLNHRNSRLEAENEKLKTDNDEREAYLKGSIDNLTMEISSLHHWCSEYKKRVEEKDKEIRDLIRTGAQTVQERCEEISSENERLKNKINSMALTVKDLEKSNQRLKNTNGNLLDNLRGTKDAFKDFRKRRNESVSELETEKEYRTRKEARIKGLKQENKRLRSEKNQMLSHLNEVNKVTESLNLRDELVEVLQNKINDLRTCHNCKFASQVSFVVECIKLCGTIDYPNRPCRHHQWRTK